MPAGGRDAGAVSSRRSPPGERRMWRSQLGPRHCFRGPNAGRIDGISDTRRSRVICRNPAICRVFLARTSSQACLKIVVSPVRVRSRSMRPGSIASGSDLLCRDPWCSSVTSSAVPAKAELVIRAVRSTVRSIAGFPPRPRPSDASEVPDGYVIYGTMGHCDPTGHQVEGLVRGFPGGGSSPLRRMKRKPRKCGAFALPGRARSVGCAIDAETSMAFAPRGLDL
jgi:hypothetical protein